jgi:hypothetical protein
MIFCMMASRVIRMPPIPRKANGFEAARPDEAVDQACANFAVDPSDAQDSDMQKIDRIR